MRCFQKTRIAFVQLPMQLHGYVLLAQTLYYHRGFDISILGFQVSLTGLEQNPVAMSIVSSALFTMIQKRIYRNG